MRPVSMRLMSSMSLTMESRCRALAPILFRPSRVRGEMPSSRSMMLSRPMMALMGVRISWLIRDRNWDLARLALSAASAEATARFLAPWV